MAINLTKVLSQIQNRISDSATNARDLNKLVAAASRINNSGTQVLTYQSTGHLPSLADSNYIGVIARVASDNVFGDSDGRYYYASGTDSGWRGFKTTQDSADAAIEAPAAGPTTQPYEGSPYQGLSRAYVFGGSFENAYQKTLYSSDGNATDVADIHPSGLLGAMPGLSDTHGYVLGGRTPPNSYINTIQRFPYASEGNTADAGYDLVQAVYSGNLTAIGNRDKIYNTGGTGPAAPDHYERITHSSLSNATDVGNLTPGGAWGQYMGGASSTTKGYSLGGRRNGSTQGTNAYYSFPFASEGNMVDTANLSTNLYYNSGASSNEDGYSMGGQRQSPSSLRFLTIDKFPFAAEGDASSSNDMQLTPGSGISRTTASSSPSFGYVYGGSTGPGTAIVDIQKFPFASVAAIADVGDLITTNNSDMGATDV